jgi:NAD-dependent dihydropyrimidine dehydrogenase PreA subunit
MYRVKRSKEDSAGFQFGGSEKKVKGRHWLDIVHDAAEARADGDMETFNRLISELNTKFGNEPRTQVLPLRDAKAVVEIAQGPLGALMCNCRYRHRAQETNNLWEYSCLGLGTGMLKWERWPERYKGGVGFMSPSQAKEWLEYWDKKGHVHMLMQEGQDFIGGLCNCVYPTCGDMRGRLDYGLTNQVVKGEYVAKVDYDLCNGCGACSRRCQFGALTLEATLGKANINAFKCFGCGLCETACPTEAIQLIPRKDLPALKDVW